MRRLLSVLFLLCFAWTQAAAVDCSTAPSAVPAPESVAHVDHADGGHSHGGHHASAPAPRPHDHGPSSHEHGPGPAHHATSGCVLAMSCGTAALPSTAAHADGWTRADSGAHRRTQSAHDDHSPDTDSPPPRLAMLS